MPRERKSAKNKASVNDDGTGEPPVKVTKKRRGSAANAGGMRGGNANQNNGDAMVPPQPMGSGYGDTLYASNPFDDTPPMCPPQSHGMSPGMGPMPPGGPHGGGGPLMNPTNQMMPGNGMMGPGGGMISGGGPPRGAPPPSSIPGGPYPPPHQKPMGPMGSMNGPPPGPPGMMPPSGRIYPPETSMVFNSANPNAPPIYPCGQCHKEIHDNDQAMLCESGCNFWYHRSCVGMSERAYQLLNSEVYAEWVCDNCLKNKNIPLIKYKS